MNKTVTQMNKYSTSETVKALNPEFYGLSHKETIEPVKPLISNRSDIAPHSWNESTDEQKLNKTEKAYLGFLRSVGNIWVGVQCISLKLGDDCRYNPDFLIINPAGFFELHEVKGFMREDALVKLKTCARMYRFFKVFLVRKEGLSWKIEQVRA